MRFAVAFVAVMLWSSAVCAQTKPTKDDLLMPTFVYAATAGADWAVTSICLKVHCDESPYVGLVPTGVDGPKKGVSLALAIDFGVAVAIRYWVYPKYPKLAKTLLYGLSAVRVTVMTHRISDLRRNAVRVRTGG